MYCKRLKSKLSQHRYLCVEDPGKMYVFIAHCNYPLESSYCLAKNYCARIPEHDTLAIELINKDQK